jgi:hypothetical protein
LELIEKFGRDIPDYAVLSHTWGSDEVLYEHVCDGSAHEHEAYSKVISAVRQAASDGFSYIWIDSCCINKSSSAELSEALNSMYTWYQRASVCYAFLEDVPEKTSEDFRTKFAESRWFTRGWTLQELLAPVNIEFFGIDHTGAWTLLGDRVALQVQISEITSIEVDYLSGLKDVHDASIAKRMSWAADRETKREEDIAYCLLGLFSINMPMLYGEGPQAFLRLQEEIIRRSDDQSIFAWKWRFNGEAEDDRDTQSTIMKRLVHHTWIAGHSKQSATAIGVEHGLLADSPSAFRESHAVVPCRIIRKRQTPYQMSNRGLSINLPLIHLSETNVFVALLECRREDCPNDKFLGIFLKKTDTGSDQYVRIRCERLRTDLSPADCSRTDLFVRQAVTNELAGEATTYLLLRSLRCDRSRQESSHVATQVVYFKPSPDGELKPREIFIREASQREAPNLPRTVLQLTDTCKRHPEQPVAAVVFERRSDHEQLLVLIGVTRQLCLTFAVVEPESEKKLDAMALPSINHQRIQFHSTLHGGTDDGDHIVTDTNTIVQGGRTILVVNFNMWTCNSSCSMHKAMRAAAADATSSLE